MKRKGRSAVGKQRDSCDVWLDPSALKRRKVMNVATKSALTLLGQDYHLAAIIGPPHSCTKQTTISTFFTTQKAGEKTTDPNRQLTTSASNAVVNLEDSELLRGTRTKDPASVLQPSSLPACQRQPAKATDISGPFLYNSPAQSRPSTFPVAQEEDAVTEGEAFLTTHLTPHLEGKQQLALTSPLREKNDGWQREGERPILFSPRSPSFKIIPNQRRDGGKRRRLPSSWAGATFVDDSENMDPELEENLPEAAHLRDFNQAGFCRESTDATSSENSSSLASTQRLFTQDSEGYRVILHRLGGGEGSKPSLSKELWWGKGTPVRSSFNNKSCFRDGWAGDRSPPGSLGRRRASPPPTDRSEKSCYDLLFTEDSEGNKVIKH